jgi:DNA-binding response OmpR family regulator
MRVLLIEDDSATAQSIELMLKSEDFNVYTTDPNRRRDLLSWRDLHSDAILFQSGRKAGDLAPAVSNPPITPFSGPH